MKTTTDFFEEGEKFRSAGQIDQAIQAYKKAIELDSNHIEAHNNLGFILRVQGSIEEAIPYFEKCLEINPEYYIAFRNLALCYQSDNPDKAIEYYNKVLEVKPDIEDLEAVLNSIGVIYFEQEENEKAETYFQQSLEANPNFKYAIFNLGLIYQRLNKKEKAEEYFQKTLEKDPNYINAYLNLGKLQIEKSPEKANQTFSKFIELSDDKVNDLNDIGIAYYELKQYDKAIEYYYRCLEIDKNFHSAYFNIALSYEKNEPEKAIEYYKKANKANPKWEKPDFQIGIIYYNKNQLKLAEEHFYKCLEINPDHNLALYRIALCYQYADPKKSKDIHRQVIEKDPQHFDSNLDLGRLYFLENNLEKAVEYFNKSLEINPNSKWALFNIGFSYSRTEPEKGIDFLEKAIEIDHEYFDAYNNIYFCIAALEDKKIATQNFIKLVEDKNTAQGFWALGNLYQYSLMDFPKANYYYEKSMLLYDNPDIALDISNLYEMMNDNEKSLEILDNALVQNEDFTYAMHNKAHYLFKMGRYAESREVWEDVAKKYENQIVNDINFSSFGNNYLYLGTIYREIFEQFDEALEIINKGILLDPLNLGLLVAANQNYVEIHNKSVQPDIKNFWKRNSNIQKAEQVFQSTLKIEDDYFNMGELYFVEEKHAKAAAILDEFSKNQKPSSRILALQGLVNLALGKFRIAIQNFKDAERLLGQNLSLMTNLANAYFKNKEFSKAESAFLKVLKIDPNNVDALIGLGEINLDRADDTSNKDLLDVAEKYFIDALKIGKTDKGSIRLNIHESRASIGVRKFKDLKLSDLYYSLGYIKTKQFEKDKISFDKSYLNEALRYFSKSFESNPDNFKAQAAKSQILKFSNTSKKASRTERFGAGLISVMAILLFVLAQYFFFFRNNTSTEFSLGKENATFLQSALPLDSLQDSKLTSLAGVRFKSKSSLLNAINEIAGQQSISEMGILPSLTFSKTTSEKDNNKLTPGFFALISFGSLIFLIAGLYLPKLLKLKVGVIEIEKNAPTETKSVSFLGIQK